MLAPCVALGQDFAPIGAIWHYGYHTYPPGQNSFVRITSVGDTVIAALPCKKLERYYPHDKWGLPPAIVDTFYMHSRNDSIFLWDTITSQYYLLYDFNAIQGETWTVGYFGIDSVLVDSTGTITINANALKVLYTTGYYTVVSPYFEGTFIERIGWTMFLLPRGDGFLEHPLRCYEDTVIGYYNTGEIAQCDSIILSLKQGSEPSKAITLYPNPTSGIFAVQGATGSIKVYDLFGRLILTTTESQIDMSDQPKGIYLVRVGQAVRKLLVQ